MKRHHRHLTRVRSSPLVNQGQSLLNELAVAKFEYEKTINNLRREEKQLEQITQRLQEVQYHRDMQLNEKERIYEAIAPLRNTLIGLKKEKSLLSTTLKRLKESNECIQDDINISKTKIYGVKRARSLPDINEPVDKKNTSQMLSTLKIKMSMMRFRKKLQNKAQENDGNKQGTTKQPPITGNLGNSKNNTNAPSSYKFPLLKQGNQKTIWPKNMIL